MKDSQTMHVCYSKICHSLYYQICVEVILQQINDCQQFNNALTKEGIILVCFMWNLDCIL